MAADSLIADWKIGSDVEYFVQRITTGEIVSAEGHVQGTKDAPHRFNPAEPMFATQLDNVLAEGNIPPTAYNHVFRQNLSTLRTHLDAVLRPKDLRTLAIGAARLDPIHLQTENAKTLGCAPSMNCWTMESAPVELRDPNVRSAGFHIHIGYKNPTPEVNVLIARTMDALLGVGSLLHEPNDNAVLRREVGYGLSGNFRHQPHGVEYRVLSSFFARDSVRITWTYYNTAAVLSWLNNVVNAKKYHKLQRLMTYAADVQAAINGPYNEHTAKNLLLEFRDVLGLCETDLRYCS